MNGTVLTLVRRVLVVTTALVALFVPLRIGEQPAASQVADVEVLVVLDRTRSMAAYDYDGGKPRWDGAQADLEALAEALPGARFALLTFGSDAHLDLPFTTDAVAFRTALETTLVEPIIYASGSRADRPLQETLDVLERAERTDPDQRRFVVFVGDGENTEPGFQKSYAEVADHVAGGAVLGYGTEEGARMPEAEDLGPGEGWVTDYDTFAPAISHADLDNLQTIADQMGVDFVHRAEPGGMDDIAAGFKAEYHPEEDGERPAAHDYVWVAGLVVALLVLWELAVVWHAVWTTPGTLRPRRTGARR